MQFTETKLPVFPVFMTKILRQTNCYTTFKFARLLSIFDVKNTADCNGASIVCISYRFLEPIHIILYLQIHITYYYGKVIFAQSQLSFKSYPIWISAAKNNAPELFFFRRHTSILLVL